MPIKRYYASGDTTIVNSYKSDLVTRSTDSNTGQSDILEVYSIHGRASSESVERSRILIKFDISKLEANPLPPGTKYYLKLFNAKHGESLPVDFSICVKPIAESWEEGSGLDLIRYGDTGHASWDGRSPTRIAQVVSIELNSINPAHYQNQYISLFDTTKEKYNFFFKTVAEDSSGLPTGQDVEVDLSDLGALSVAEKFQDVLTTHAQFAAQEDQDILTITNVLPGAASDPIISVFDDAANQPTSSVTTQGADYTSWSSTPGGEYTAILDEQQQEVSFERNFELGTEDMEVDITSIVESWLSAAQGSLTNHGLGVMLKAEFEDGSRSKSYYTKRFFGRRSQFVLQRPAIEARYTDYIQDDSTILRTASPHAQDASNTLRIYYSNYESGVLTDLSEAPKFTLTTDKALTDSVTLAPNNVQNAIITSPSSDYTENAYVEIKVTNTAAHDDNGFINSFLRISHLDADSNQVSNFDFIGRYDYWNAPSEREDIFPVNKSNTQANRIAAAQAISDELNAFPGFTALFVAAAAGENVRIYSKVQGDPGQNSSVSVHSLSTDAIHFLEFATTPAQPGVFSPWIQDNDPNQEGDQNAGNEYDSILQLSAAAYVQYRAGSSASALMPDLSVVLNNATTLAKRTRAFRGNTGVNAEVITSDAVPGTNGVYVAEFKIANNVSTSTLYKKWWIGEDTPSNLLEGHSGNRPVRVVPWHEYSGYNPTQSTCKIIMKNLQESYSSNDIIKFSFDVRDFNANLNIRTTNSTSKYPGKVLGEIYYRLYRVSDNYEVISYNEALGTDHNRISFDGTQSTFELDMSILEEGYMYAIQFMVVEGSNKKQLDQVFKFRIKE